VKRSLISSTLALLTVAAPAVLTFLAPATAEAADDGSIRGVVTNSNTGDPIDGALVILQCSCLTSEVEATTNSRGIYRFDNLPPGNYTIQVLSGKANVSKVTQLPRSAQFRANFKVNPNNEFVKKIIVESQPVRADTSTTTSVDMEQAKNLPVGGSTSRDFTAVVDLAPSASRDSAGISLAGTSGAESKYTVEGANVSSPAFGTVGASIIQEFVEQVDIQESGYDAEFGGASGGQVQARRVSGTNVLRGETGIRVTPRIADPRFITGTDEALRVTLIPDVNAQAYAVMSGPIIKDKLFFTVGVVPTGTQFTLKQQFYNRLDKDNSQGFEDCPFENGDNDCADGKDFILTEKFAEQTFRTGAVQLGYIAGLDYAINPRHRLRLTVQGGPSFNRVTYRLPFTQDPNAFGTNPAADPLGGASRIATGVVNDHFGWDLGSSTLVALGYEGRVADDKLEIDAGVSYFEAGSQTAWRVDNPDNKKIPTTQEQNGDGRNLFEFLDREGRVSLVPGVDEACNDPSLPGVACPVRVWLSGGIGEFGEQKQRRVEGRLSLTHFFSTGKAGNHQLKYGANIEYLTNEIYSKFSGSNSAGFDNNCPDGQKGGGEYCYDPAADDYNIERSLRVNNNRFMIVNPNTPEQRLTRGYGRVRKEQNDLRAIASPIGDGVRVSAYDEATSTFNYAVYLQDKWSILSNLYLNAGVRWEIQDMRDILGRQALLITDNVAPRVGMVYDWTDEGKSRLYASYGWFYQPLPLQLNNRVFGGLVNVQRSYRLSDCLGQTVTTSDGTFDKYRNGQPTEYCADSTSGGTGFTTGLTRGNVVPNLKGQYNQQFQLGYEQEVVEDLVLGFRWLHTDLGRAVEDVSTDGGNNFIIANPGEKVSQDAIRQKQNRCDELSAQLEMLDSMGASDEERAQVARETQRCQFLVDAYNDINTLFDPPSRNYDAWTFQVKKRFAKNWLLIGSYTYSRLVGNYDGFVDPITGAINLGASTQYDLPELVRNSYGPLSFNQPHVGKVDGFYSFDLRQAGRLTLGTSFRVQSGYPVNIRADQFRYAGSNLLYLLPRGAGGRIEPNYRWNLNFGYAYPLPKDLELEFTARLINITNAKAVLRVDEVYSFQSTRGIPGGEISDLKHAKVQGSANGNQFFSRNILAPQGNFGVETSFQQPLSAQFELKLRF